jgi:hypothetical protein
MGYIGIFLVFISLLFGLVSFLCHFNLFSLSPHSWLESGMDLLMEPTEAKVDSVSGLAGSLCFFPLRLIVGRLCMPCIHLYSICLSV